MEERKEMVIVDSKETSEESVCHFEKLTPMDNVDIAVYEDAINFVFENEDINNVAISGAYGSGKSSVLATYEKKYTDRKYVHISLAHFEKEGKEERPERAGHDTTILEEKIVNQLVHQIGEEKIPLSNFKLKKTIQPKVVAWRTVYTAVWIVCLLHMLLSVEWITFVQTVPNGIVRSILNLSISPYAFLLSGVVVFAICTYCIWAVVKAQKYRSILRKISLQGNEIDISQDENNTFFDKYLNEVLYLFEQIEADVIVFEDMDRYDKEVIFERLREINALINLRLKQKGKKAIKFLFLLRDDLFTSKNRTKFFDYIIPVVPVVDSSNSYDQLLKHMEKNSLEEKFARLFLQRISLYIDDMRLLKNICNEFLIYSRRLGKTELDNNKLFAIITYKNIFPQDFSDLQLKKGFVYAIIGNKKTIIEEESDQLQKEIDTVSSKIRACERDSAQALREIDAIFVDKYYKTSANIALALNDDKLQEWLQVRLKDERLEEYTHRRTQLKQNLDQDVNELTRRLLDLKEQLQTIANKKLAEIIDRDNIDRIFAAVSLNALGEQSTHEEVKRSQYFNLLRYLIREGYIDESYTDYMTYFYPHSLTTSDKVFLQSVTNKVAKPYNYELKNVALVLEKLNEKDFKEEEILNFSLLNYIFKEESAEKYVHHIIEQLKVGEKFDFISQYLATTPDRAIFVLKINAEWPEFFSVVCKDMRLPPKQLWELAHDILLYSPKEDIQVANIDSVLTKYISAQADFLNISLDESKREEQVGRLVRGISLLGVKFHAIDYLMADHELFVKIYEHDCYEINSENVELMLRIIYCETNKHDLSHKNYSLVTSKTNTPLCQYMEREIAKYVETMLSSCKNRIEDDEHYVLNFLNHSEISVEQKKQYINRLCTKITALEDVHDSSLWGDIISAKILQSSENNILTYWLKFESVDNMLTYYINCFDKRIDMAAAAEVCEKERRVKFFEQIIESKEIWDDKYIQILASMNLSYQTNFGIKGVPDNKIQLLIKWKIIWMTSESLQSIRANYPNVRYLFIKQNFDEYIKAMTPQLVVHEEVLEILSWSVSEEAKISLLKHAKTPISVVGKSYSTTIILYILENRIDVNDLPELYTSYSKLDKEIRAFVVTYAATKIEAIITGTISTSNQLTLDLLGSEKITENNKYKLLLCILPEVSRTVAQMCFSRMGLSEFSKIFDTHTRPKILKTTLNQQILKVLQENRWIYDYPDYQYDHNYYTVRRNMPSKKRTLAKV